MFHYYDISCTEMVESVDILSHTGTGDFCEVIHWFDVLQQMRSQPLVVPHRRCSVLIPEH